MPANPWDHSQILLSNNAGANWARGIDQAARGFSRGIEAWSQAEEKRKKEEATVEWLESTPEAVNALFPKLANVQDPSERKKAIKAGIKGAGLENVMQVQGYMEQRSRQAAQDRINAEMAKLKMDETRGQMATESRERDAVRFAMDPSGFMPRVSMDSALQKGAGFRDLGMVEREMSQLTPVQRYARAGGGNGQIAAQMMQESRLSSPTATKPSSNVGKMLADLNAARASGDTESVKFMTAALEDAVTPSGMSLETGPDGQIIFRQGKGVMTTSSTTKSQESQYNSERVLKEGAQLFSTLRPQDVGVVGVVKEDFVNKALGQINPALVDQLATENRTRLRAWREGTLKAISDDSKFSNADRSAIEKMLPQDGVFESLPSAQGKLLAVMQIMKDRASTQAARRGEKSIADLSPDEMKALVQEGKMDEGVALALISAMHPTWKPTK